jgi:hypothetical protein
MAAPGGKPGILSLRGNKKSRRVAGLSRLASPTGARGQQCPSVNDGGGEARDQASWQQCRGTIIRIQFYWPSFLLLRTERRRSKGEEPHESWGSGDGSSTSLDTRDPVTQMERDVNPSKGVRGDPAIKAWVCSSEYKL